MQGVSRNNVNKRPDIGKDNFAFSDNHETDDNVIAKDPANKGVEFDNGPSDQSSNTSKDNGLIYNISDTPPFHLTLFFGLQQALVSLADQLVTVLIVADIVCAGNDQEFKTKLLGTSFVMSGVTTFLNTFFGVRLPLLQAAAVSYIVPLLAMADLNKEQCRLTPFNVEAAMNASLLNNETFSLADFERSRVLSNTQLLQGSLIVAALIHCLVGMTGLVGILLRFIGPVTIVPSIFLIGLYIMRVAVKFAKVQWGVSFLTFAISIILALYMGKIKLPFPAWTKRKGCHVIRYPYQQMFSIMIALLIGSGVCGILTATDTISYNKNSTSFNTRTDARSHVISTSNWFYFPYPGQFGPIRFSTNAFVGFLVATFMSILDSIGDYYACASMCRVPPPPSHAVNRGIAIDGFCGVISGLLGAGHATTTFGSNIGAIGVTRVSSRSVFMVCALIYMLFGIVGKVSAVFISIPYPVLGGVMVTMFGMFIGVTMSNLKTVDLGSSRNLAIMGISIFIGVMVPFWIDNYSNELDTGSEKADELLTIFLGNPNLLAAVLACFLDNTVPGTLKERGIATWQTVGNAKDSGSAMYVQGYDVYDPPLYRFYKRSKILKYLPIMPKPENTV